MNISSENILNIAVILAALGLLFLVASLFFYIRKKRMTEPAKFGVNVIDSGSRITIMEQIPFPVWKRNNDFSIKYCNPVFAKILEKDRDGIIGNSAELFSGSNDMSAKAIATNSPQKLKTHVVVSGNRRLFDVTEVPLPDGGTIGFARDVTEFEEIEHELKRHMAVQTKLLESLTSAVAIYDSDKRIKFFNGAFVKLWKLDERWLATQPTYGEILEVLREKRKLPEQANFQKFKKTALDMFTNLIEKNEELYFLPDGIILRVVIIPHEHGGLLFSYEDMTNQVALERSYNTLLSVNKSTIDNLYEGVVAFGENGRVQLSNPVFADIWQLDDAFLKSEPHISELLDECKFLYDYGDSWEKYKQEIITLINQRTPNRKKYTRTDGSIVEMSTVPLPNGATLVTYIDITDSTRVEQSLRAEKEAIAEADRIKTNFLANVSYELRSPLTSIKGFSEILLKHYFGEMNEKQEEYVRGIYDSSLRLTSLIDNILDVASIDAGYMKLDTGEFDVKEMLEKSAAIVSPGLEKNNLKLEFDIPEKIGTMIGDRKRIQQAVVHLLSNAISFSDPGDKVILKAEYPDNETITISVEDMGKGITPEEQKYIFQKFYTSSTDSYSGTGLGLTITKSFIELHGGRIELKSDIGVGTTVTCVLKRRNPDLLKIK